MKKIIKIVSIAMVFALCLSTFAFAAPAENTIDVKFDLTRVDDINGYAAPNDVYKLTIYMQSTYGISSVNTAIHYNKQHFSPVNAADEYGVFVCEYLSAEEYYNDVVFDLEGDLVTDTNMYTTAGAIYTGAASRAGAFGLANSNAGTSYQAKWYAPEDTTNYPAWAAGLSDEQKATTGIVNWYWKVNKAKTCYFMAQNDYEPMVSLYFMLNDGVEISEAMYDEFEIITDATKGFDYTWSATSKTKFYYTASDAQTSSATAVNVYEGVRTPVYGLKEQIRFNTNDDGSYAGNFDYRYVAKIDGEDFAALFTDEATAKKGIVDIGFVFADQANVATFDVAAAKALVEKGTATSGYAKKDVSYLQRDGSDYIFTCLVTGISNPDDAAHALGYVAYDTNGDGAADTYGYYSSAVSSSFSNLYNTYYSQAFPA